MIPVLTPAQAAAWDSRAERSGIALATLMESAGRAAAAVLLRDFAAPARNGVIIAAGTGHNGGDGWVLARALNRLGIPAWVTALPGSTAALTSTMAGLALAEGVREVAPDGPWPNAGILVDAILGTGASGAPRSEAAALLERMADLNLPIVAIDGPSGVDLATGVSHGAHRASLTITFGGVRRGHLLARDEVGEVVVVDIGHPGGEPGWPRLVDDASAASRLGELGVREHKGTRGRIVIVGGDAGMSGAVRLAGRAAFAAGAGLVHVAAPSSTIEALRAAEPDIQTLETEVAGEPGEELLDLVERSDVLVIGPGLGRGPAKAGFVRPCLARARAAVIDADAIVALQGMVSDMAALATSRSFILTPHAGEFRTLFPQHASERETDPWGAAERASAEAHATVLLKGVPTAIARMGRPTLTVAAGNPGLATGGSGDVLSGILGAMLAREPEPDVAAALAAQALGRAADLAARRVTARAMRPMDVIGALPDLWREWEATRRTGAAVEPPVLLRLVAPRTA